MTLTEFKDKTLELVSKERKVAAFLTALVALGGGFVLTVVRPAVLEAYRAYAEWVTYLTAAFFAGNALSYFGKGKTNGQ